jgi:hypothetical protein
VHVWSWRHLLVEDVRTLLVLEGTLLIDPHVHLLLADTTQNNVRSRPTDLESLIDEGSSP